MIALRDTLIAAESVVARKVGDDLVLLDLESGQYFGLDNVGCKVWNLIESQPHSLYDIVGIIYSEYDASREQIESDLIELADALAEKKLVVVA